MSVCSVQEALERLKEGNRRYCSAEEQIDTSPALRTRACEGQSPYAVILSCSDSRVIPEAVFDANLGDLFVIRVAGNVVDSNQAASILYAAEHLHSALVLVLAHTQCGAVAAALGHNSAGLIRSITDEIEKAIGTESDAKRASCLNALHSRDKVIELLHDDLPDLPVYAAIYHLDDGHVEFLEPSK